MSIIWSRMVFFLLLAAFSLSSTAFAGKKIALDIYLADEVAFRSQHAFYMKDLFAKLFPEIEYRQVLVPSSVIGLHKQETRDRIIEQLKTAVAPDDTLHFLILDTHGNTIETEGQTVTSLAHLGRVGPEQVDRNFDEIFSGIRNRAASNLTVIMNSCSTFCGPAEESQKRAQTLLNYFSAKDGRIYGAYVKEVDNVYLDPSGFKLKALLPSWKIYLTTVSVFAAAIGLSPLLDGSFQSLEILKATLHGALYFGLPFATLVETVSPIFSWLAGRTWANRGWLFVFKDGKLQDQINVQKPRDLQAMLRGQVRSCSGLHR